MNLCLKGIVHSIGKITLRLVKEEHDSITAMDVSMNVSKATTDMSKAAADMSADMSCPCEYVHWRLGCDYHS